MTEQEKRIIEEMAVTIANFRIQICKIGNCKTCTSRIDTNKECYFVKQAKAIYNAGYRKERQGEWIITNNRNLEIIRECSNCHCKTYYPIDQKFNCRKSRYCEDCGAKMKGADNDT